MDWDNFDPDAYDADPEEKSKQAPASAVKEPLAPSDVPVSLISSDDEDEDAPSAAAQNQPDVVGVDPATVTTVALISSDDESTDSEEENDQGGWVVGVSP